MWKMRGAWIKFCEKCGKEFGKRYGVRQKICNECSETSKIKKLKEIAWKNRKLMKKLK